MGVIRVKPSLCQNHLALRNYSPQSFFSRKTRRIQLCGSGLLSIPIYRSIIKCLPLFMGNTADHGQTGEYKIARLDEDKLPDVSRLHQKIYGITPKENYFHEKYDTSYTGVMHIGFLAYDKNNEPVAFYGVIPCFIQLGNRIVPAAQSADTMTHPSHRNKGLFTRLATLTFELCRQAGIAFVFGFPNQNSHHGLLALGWKVTERMERFSIPV